MNKPTSPNTGWLWFWRLFRMRAIVLFLQRIKKSSCFRNKLHSAPAAAARVHTEMLPLLELNVKIFKLLLKSSPLHIICFFTVSILKFSCSFCDYFHYHVSFIAWQPEGRVGVWCLIARCDTTAARRSLRGWRVKCTWQITHPLGHVIGSQEAEWAWPATTTTILSGLTARQCTGSSSCFIVSHQVKARWCSLWIWR